LPAFEVREAAAAIDFAVVLQHTSKDVRAGQLLDRAESYYRGVPCMGVFGSGYSDARIPSLTAIRILCGNYCDVRKSSTSSEQHRLQPECPHKGRASLH
jgi:hypothetical protein